VSGMATSAEVPETPFDRSLLPAALRDADLEVLAREFGTPLFVYDEEHLRQRCRDYVAQFGAEILVGRHYGAALLCITPLALVVAWIAAPVDLGGLVADRVIETVIGCAVGVAVVLVGSGVARRFGGRAGVAG